MMEVFSGKTFLLVTGASQGIGREIAIKFSNLLEKDSKALLLARNENGLMETKDKMCKNIAVEYVSVDLSSANADDLNGIVMKCNPDKYDRAIIIHNVGSVGDISKLTTEMSDFDVWRSYYDLNVFSPAILNSVTMKIFSDKKIRKLVINITSLCGIEPMKSLGFYCSGKAAREMYFKVFAEEYPQVNVLNYSPGPVETDMLKYLAENTADEDIRTYMTNLRKTSKQLTTEQTVDRLINIIKEKKYRSGVHIDYYDEI